MPLAWLVLKSSTAPHTKQRLFVNKDGFFQKHANQSSDTKSDAPSPLVFVPAHACLMTETEASAVNKDSVLAMVFFGSGRGGMSDFPHVTINADQLQSEKLVEVWTSPGPVRRLTHNDIQITANSDVLFGCVQRKLPPVGEPLETLVEQTYETLLKLGDELGYPNIIRIWNYIPGIGKNIDGLECYRRFCRARHNALERLLGEFVESLPATTAVGVSGDELTIMFMAAKNAGEQRENPRQVSAYHYPRLYGPRSPSFARATLLPWWGTGALFVSGTSSIVGHESRHLGDAEKQLQEAVENIKTLVFRSITEDHLDFDGFSSLSLVRVYLRSPEYYGLAHSYLAPLLDKDTRALYLHAEICRNELLVELEGALLPE